MDNYKVIEQLGEGSFGIVYKAKLSEQHRNDLIRLGILSNEYENKLTYAALKIISIRNRSISEVKTLWKECEIQRSLKHPNIIHMLEAFRTDNEIIVITEFAHKQLCAVLEEKRFLAEDRVHKVTCDLVSALNYLHSNNIIHRDLKPQNVLLDKNDRAKLCDFGFAKIISNNHQLLTSIKGTPLYMAPELFETRPYDYTVDLWSLGCIIYELLIGYTPFHTNCYFKLINLIKTEDVKWPRCISIYCDSFLKGLLQKAPINRFNWDQILSHPFVYGFINSQISESNINDVNRNSKSDDNLTDELRSSCSIICTPKFGSVCSDSCIDSDVDKEDDCRIDESIGFLLNSMKEIIDNDFQSLSSSIYTKVLLLPIINHATNRTILDYGVYILRLPFSMSRVSDKTLSDIENVYVEQNVVNLLLKSMTVIVKKDKNYRKSYLPSFNNIFQLILNLILKNDYFVDHFCQAVINNNCVSVLYDVLLKSANSSAAKTALGILFEVLQRRPHFKNVIELIIGLNQLTNRTLLSNYLRNENPILKFRMCCLIRLLIDNNYNNVRNGEKRIDEDLNRIVNDILTPSFVRNISRMALQKHEAARIVN